MTRRLPLWAYPLLTLLCLGLFAPGFFDIPPFDRDEARFAQASHQMLTGGDLIDIRFQDEARHKKPVGIYWLQAAAAAAALDDPAAKEIWAFRIPSLIGATLAVLATAWGGARLFGPAVGAAAAVMLASCVVLGVEARMAKTDAVLTASVAVAQLLLARFYLARDGLNPIPGTASAVAFWLAVAVGVLIKGPLILLFCGATMVMLAAWDRSIDWLKTLRWRMGLAIVAVLVAPWLIAITIKSGGAFFSESVGHDMMGKVAGGQEGKGLPPGYYLGTFWITFFPWAFLALLALPWIWRNRAEPAVRFCVAWIIPAWLVFEAVPTKLLHYTLPAFPAVALLTAAALFDPAWGPAAGGGATGKDRPWLRRAAAALFLAAAVALCLAVAGFTPLLDGRVEGWAAALGAAALLGFAPLAAPAFVARLSPQRLLLIGVSAAAVLYAAAFGRALPQAEAPWPSRWAAAQFHAHRPCPTGTLASAGFSEPSLVFLAGTATELTRGAGAAVHLRADPACNLALVEAREAEAFTAALEGTPVQALASTQALNYNNGRKLTLTLYQVMR